MRTSVHSSRFYINLNISFIYKDIFTKFAGNIYGYENMSVQNFDQLFEHHKDALNLEILQLVFLYGVTARLLFSKMVFSSLAYIILAGPYFENEF